MQSINLSTCGREVFLIFGHCRLEEPIENHQRARSNYLQNARSEMLFSTNHCFRSCISGRDPHFLFINLLKKLNALIWCVFCFINI